MDIEEFEINNLNKNDRNVNQTQEQLKQKQYKDNIDNKRKINDIIKVLKGKLIEKIKVNGSTLETSDNSVNIDLLNYTYPVGSIYISVTATNPGTFFGGTWERIKDRFLLASGDIYANGATGGEATHTLTSSEMPSHTHTFTGKAHSHGLNSHTHTYDKSATTTGGTAITVDQMPSHSHVIATKDQAGSGTSIGSPRPAEEGGVATNRSTKATGGGKTHNHSITLTSTNTGKASGNTAEATQGGTNAETGGGNAHNNMPPYLAVYIWQRTA